MLSRMTEISVEISAKRLCEVPRDVAHRGLLTEYHLAELSELRRSSIYGFVIVRSLEKTSYM
jgi:hypothetical protein